MDGNRVIEINLTSEDPILMSLNTDKEQLISMTYSVEWKYDNSIEFRNLVDMSTTPIGMILGSMICLLWEVFFTLYVGVYQC